MSDLIVGRTYDQVFQVRRIECCDGKITRSSEQYFSDIVFGPDGLRLIAVTLKRGTPLQPESYACLGCGTVWSQTVRLL